MASNNAVLAGRLDAATTAELDAVAKALQEDTANLLGTPAGTGFDAIDTASLRMTFLFFGACLRDLPATQLKHFHDCVCAEVANALEQEESLGSCLNFERFQLFPPGKMNVVVARFQANEYLLRLRSLIMNVCREHHE